MTDNPTSKPAKANRRSMILRLTLVYLALTMVNLLFFWVATGSRQMRLISEKAFSASELQADRLVSRLRSELNSKPFLTMLTADSAKAAVTAQTILRNLADDPFLKTAQQILILTDRGEKLAGTDNSEPEPVVLQLLLKAIQQKEQRNSLYLMEPDATTQQLRFLLPLAWSADNSVALYFQTDLPGVKEELDSLYRFAYTLIAVILGVQFLFGIYLFKTVLQPLSRLNEGAREVTSGNLTTHVRPPRYRDELHELAENFNRMTGSLHEKTEKLKQSITILEEKDAINQMELELARSIQEGIIPTADKIPPCFLAAVEYRPLHSVSGDYYDFFQLPDGACSILIADASGHGVPAAFVTVMARIIFDARVAHSPSPAELFSDVNKDLEKTITTPDYLTAFYIIVGPDGSARFSNASHPTPILLRKDGSIEFLKTDGFFLGSMYPPPYDYTESAIRLSSGDVLILYTDGITEAENERREEFGQQRLLATIEANRNGTPDQLKDAILDSLKHHSGSRKPFDDSTLIVLEYRGSA